MTQPSPTSRPQDPRLPDFKRFLVTGAVLGFLVGVAVSVFGEHVENYSAMTGALYIGALGAFLGTGLAGVLAVILDRSGRGRS